MPRITVILNPNDPRKKYRYADVDICNDCYPPDPGALAELTGVSVENAIAAIVDADFLGHYHGQYEEDEMFCNFCCKMLEATDN